MAALHRQAWFQARIECGAMIEHETVASVMIAADFFEIFQDAAIELVHAVVTDIFHIDRGFFAAYAAGAESDDSLVVQCILVPSDEFREFAEFVDTVIDGVVESADIDFKRIARIHHDDSFAIIVMTMIQPALERGRIDGRCAAFFVMISRLSLTSMYLKGWSSE